MIDDTTSHKTAVKFDAKWNILVKASENATDAEIKAEDDDSFFFE